MRILLTLSLLILSTLSFSQLVNDRLLIDYEMHKSIYLNELGTFTSFKPKIIETNVNPEKPSWVINPAFDAQAGLENEGETPNQFAIGLDVKSKWKKWQFGATYLFNSGEYMNYQERRIIDSRVIPSMNVSRGKNRLEADYISAYLNYRLNSTFDFEAGYGRNFIGDGYRSLLLSDIGNASPYFRINTKIWKIKYSNLFSSHQDIFNNEGSPSSYAKKYTVTHFLDWQATKWLTVGLFESIIWQAKENGYTRGFDVNYLNPVIFYRPVEFSVGSSDNAVVGVNLKAKIKKKYIVYSQLVFDEFLLSEIRADLNQWRNPNEDIQSGWWANKYGLQFGLLTFDLFQIQGLKLRSELNLVRPYTYAHSNPTQSYTNYNQSLAHPLGANFHEWIGIISYNKEKWIARFKYVQARRGISPVGTNFGENLQLSNISREREYENKLTQGIPEFVRYLESSISYVLKKEWNATISLGVILRDEQIDNQKDINSMMFVKIKTNLFNQYFDY